MWAVPHPARSSSSLRNMPNKVRDIRKGSLVDIHRGSPVDIRRGSRLPAILLAINPRQASRSNRTRNRVAIPRPVSLRLRPVSLRLRPVNLHPHPVSPHPVAYLACHFRFPVSRPRPQQVVAVAERAARPRSSIRTSLRPPPFRSRHSPTARLRACRRKAHSWRPTSSRARL